MDNYQLIQPPPQPVGFWEICPPPLSFGVPVAKKPNWFHRKVHELILGWKWIDDSI